MAKFYILNGTKIMLSQAAYDYYKNIGANIRPATSADAKKKTYAQGSSYGPGQNNNPPSNSGGNTPANTGKNAGFIRGDFAHDKDQWGFDYLYGERDFQSDEDIWKKGIEPLHDKHKEQQLYIDKKIEGLYETRRTKKQIEQILIDYYGDDIKRLDAGHAKQETRITANAEAIKSHGHASNGDGKDCGWFGEKCWFPNPDDYTWIKYVAIAIGIGIFLWLLRPLMKIGANLTK